MLKTCKYSVAYTGELQEKTLLREGQGTYRYKNSFFKYQGEWKSTIHPMRIDWSLPLKQGRGKYSYKNVKLVGNVIIKRRWRF